MKCSPRKFLTLLLSVVALGVSWYVAGTRSVQAQEGARSSHYDDLQRSIRINGYNEVADSGPGRGETLYFYKCWVCHNKYTIEENPREAAPYIPDLIKEGTLRSGRPLTDETLADVIKQGGPRMPAYRWSLTDADIADLISYIRSPRFPWEATTNETQPANPWYRAEKQPWPVQTVASGGARGVVRTHLSERGDSPEGIKVQLIAPNGVRTTVQTDAQGRYEFPRMQAGTYTLRIATPLEFKPFRREVRINPAGQPTTFDDIVLDRVYEIDLSRLSRPAYNAEGLPPTRDIEWQLSDSELLWNLPGTAHEKETLRLACSNGCHSYKQMFRARFDEHGWRLMIDRMVNYSQSPLIIKRTGAAAGGVAGPEHIDVLAKWLAKVRGPDSPPDAPYYTFPRARGASTRVVVTEYELPYALMVPHDVVGDEQGNIWFTPHRSEPFGKLDPRTGVVTMYPSAPLDPAAKGFRTFPGYNPIYMDPDPRRKNWMYLNEGWRQRTIRVDTTTGKVIKVFTGGTQDPDFPETGAKLSDAPRFRDKLRHPITDQPLGSYDRLLSPDGNWVARGSDPFGGNTAQLMDVRTGTVHHFEMGARRAGPSKGLFDPFGSAWFGGRAGSFIELDTRTLTLKEHVVPNGPVTYMSFYEVRVDKNGEVWAGIIHGRGFMRYNPRTERWTEYVMPEPYGHDRRTWIDDSTDPVTVWYTDHNGYLVRIQPLESSAGPSAATYRPTASR